MDSLLFIVKSDRSPGFQGKVRLELMIGPSEQANEDGKKGHSQFPIGGLELVRCSLTLTHDNEMPGLCPRTLTAFLWGRILPKQ